MVSNFPQLSWEQLWEIRDRSKNMNYGRFVFYQVLRGKKSWRVNIPETKGWNCCSKAERSLGGGSSAPDSRAFQWGGDPSEGGSKLWAAEIHPAGPPSSPHLGSAGEVPGPPGTLPLQTDYKRETRHTPQATQNWLRLTLETEFKKDKHLHRPCLIQRIWIINLGQDTGKVLLRFIFQSRKEQECFWNVKMN